MKLDSVRSIKREVSAEVVAAAGDSPAAFSFYAATEPPMPAGIALGVTKQGEEHAVLVVAATQAEAQPYVDRAKGEAVVRLLQVTKRTTPGYCQGARRPLECGLQVGMADKNFVGTLGCIVKDKDDHLYVLSNSHVLADEGRALAGHPFGQPFGDPAHRVGVLARFIPFSTTSPNLVDAAIGRLDKTTVLPRFNGALGREIGGWMDVTAEMIGSDVLKVGRTTGARRGKITSAEVDGLGVAYDQGILRFNDQFEVSGGPSTDFSAPGDSGSLIVTTVGYAVGLLFAGGRDSSGEDFTYANRIPVVLRELGVSLA